MLSNGQKSLLKQAQRQAALADGEYREALRLVAGVESSTDPTLGDSQLDVLLSYFEAIYWRKVDQGQLPAPCNPRAIFRQRGFWAARNRSGSTTRDRFHARHLGEQISELEGRLANLGFGAAYCSAILERCSGNPTNYAAALRRVLASKVRPKSAAPAA